MSDEKLQADPEATEADQHPIAQKSNITPAIALGFVIIALLGFLIATVLKGGGMRAAASDADIKKAQAELLAIRSETNRERIAMGLRPLEGDSEPIEEIVKRVKKDSDTLVALVSSFQNMLAEKDTELSVRNGEIIRADKLRQTLSSENNRLNAELGRALGSSSDSEILRRDLENLKAQRDALAAEATAARQKLQRMSETASVDDLADLQRRLDEALRAKTFYENRVNELENSAVQPKIFANSENELLPAAVELFRNLRELEDRPDSDLTSSYSSLGVKLGANVLKTLNFATGSSALSTEDEEALRNLVVEIPDGDLLLSIGYASETGNVESNRVLSSDRATVAATLFSQIKRPGQNAQAVYLGQTDRFSSRIPERNQLVEIWHIRKK